MPVLDNHDFEAAGHAVLAHLHKRLGFTLWMITRRSGENRIILQAEGRRGDIVPGMAFQWLDSFCALMVEGRSPRMIPDAGALPLQLTGPLDQLGPVQAYIGVPLTHSDGSVFGTLCAIDPLPQPASIVQEQEQVELLASLLSRILQAELMAAEEARRNDRLEMEASVDPLTRLFNRRAWEQLLAREEERCRRFGHPSSVLAADLDGVSDVNERQGHAAGDALLLRAADALRRAARGNDIVARLGSDEFGILAGECDPAGAHELLLRTQQSLHAAEVRATLGLAMRDPLAGLRAAWETADRQVYAEKSAR